MAALADAGWQVRLQHVQGAIIAGALVEMAVGFSGLVGKLLRYVPLVDELRPMNLGLITMRSEKKSRILTAFEDHCRDRITTGTLPGMGAS